MHGQPFITLEGAKPDSTILGLTDGSRVATPWDRLDYIEDCIREGRAVTIHQPHPQTTFKINPAHIIAAVYTENGDE